MFPTGGEYSRKKIKSPRNAHLFSLIIFAA
jgi:hypothetical protein